MSPLLSPARVRAWLCGLGPSPRSIVERDILPPSVPVRAQAGVLVPFSERDGRMHVLLTRRAGHLRNHAGEMSFPGGRLDPTDPSLEFAALREAHEEVALSPQDVHVYGALARVPTLTGFEIHAFAGEYDAALALHPNPGEIDRLHDICLDTLIAPGVHRLEHRPLHGRVFPLHFYDCVGDPPIWGATAYILHEMLCALGAEH